MTPETIKKARDAAIVFLDACREVEYRNYVDYQGKTHTHVETGKKSGAVRRASMDLTRALASMRRP